VELCWHDPEHLSTADVAGAVAVLEAARLVDSPHELPTTTRGFLADTLYAWDGARVATALSRTGSGRVNAVLQVSMPRWDNFHLATVSITVDPGFRRRGLGAALFAAGVQRVRADGKTMVLADSWNLPSAVGFAGSVGLERGIEEVERLLDLTTLDWPRLTELCDAAAARHHHHYDLSAVPVPTPPALMDGIVEMTAAINDAPVDDLDVEDEVYTPERIRAFEAAQTERGRRLYRLVATRRDSGELAGHTMVAVDADQPWRGHQYDTSVLRPHRGFGLGLGLKIGMLELLSDREPQLRAIDTWNAASNKHMIEINDAIGCTVVGGGIEWQRHLR
jgi:GNAT superfamily N-acetyltransferase